MESSKVKSFYIFSFVIGVVLIIAGLLLFIPRTTRSDTPESYYYNIYILRYLLPISGVLLIIVSKFVYSSYTLLKTELVRLQEEFRDLEKKLKTKN
nr:hypothetical protein [Paenibacillus xylanexedens]